MEIFKQFEKGLKKIRAKDEHLQPEEKCGKPSWVKRTQKRPAERWLGSHQNDSADQRSGNGTERGCLSFGETGNFGDGRKKLTWASRLRNPQDESIHGE